MARVDPLPLKLLARRSDPETFGFETTEELEVLENIIGQERAVEAIEFGIGMRASGYNLFALGPTGLGKHTVMRKFLKRAAAAQPAPRDWCYVHNFKEPARPRALDLPPGRATVLRDDMARLVEEMHEAIREALESDEFRSSQQAIEASFRDRQDRAFELIRTRAQDLDVAVIRTPAGVVMAPMKDDEVLGPIDFQNLPDPRRQEFERRLAELQDEMEEAMQSIPQWERQRRHTFEALRREVTHAAIAPLFDRMRDAYLNDGPDLLTYLDAVQGDVLDHVEHFLQGAAPDPTTDEFGPEQLLEMAVKRDRIEPDNMHRYQVNVFVDNTDDGGAPVIQENYPTLENLIGRIDHQSRFGALSTDFSLIRAGSLHRANGGYLLLDVRKVLMQPLAWEQLKRALQTGEVRIEAPAQILGVISTVALEPQPIPLDLKVVLFGERGLYYLLNAFDPDFGELFKVAVDFDDRMDRAQNGSNTYARLIATLLREEHLRPLDRRAVARAIEHGARLAADSEKLTTHIEHITDLLRESDYWAGQAGSKVVGADHIEAAIEAQMRRQSRLRDEIIEEIDRGTLRIETTGERCGQVNGLSVIQVGKFAFGRPNRITASVRLGKGEVLDIEREIEMSGPAHSKGVLILAGFLGSSFARDFPLSLSASLVFEQSYGGVDGDSASLAETCALISALADVPIKQHFAITGSIDQYGQVQPVGGVNEKIEGFFDVCALSGLTGRHAAIIPESNVKHLMLSQRVLEAASRNEFRIYPVATVDEAVELLTDMPAGKRDYRQQFPEGSVYFNVEKKLAEFASNARRFMSGPSAPLA